jgi:hypothetical protein
MDSPQVASLSASPIQSKNKTILALAVERIRVWFLGSWREAAALLIAACLFLVVVAFFYLYCLPYFIRGSVSQKYPLIIEADQPARASKRSSAKTC